MELAFVGTDFLLLLAGIILSILTIRRMVTGAISPPRWAKVLLVIGMILMNLMLLLSILPPIQLEATQSEDLDTAPPVPSQTVEAAQ